MRNKPTPPEVLEQIFSDEFQSRFWSNIHIGDENECWNWKLSTNNKGYGQVNLGRQTGKLVMGLTHRVAWISHHGQDVPGGLGILHSCDNTRCCNPNHLNPGTQRENAQHMDMRGRRVNRPLKGEAHGSSRLTREQILDIRAKYATGNFTYPQLGAMFGMGKTYVSKIVRRIIWDSV